MTLTPDRLASIINESGVKYKIVIIGACFSGVFVPALQDENTMIITASAGNKPAYECSDDADLTYFAQAYFQQALAQSTDLEEAFYIARDLIVQREKDEKITVTSEPPIYVGKGIREALKKYKPLKLISAKGRDEGVKQKTAADSLKTDMSVEKYGPPEKTVISP